MHPCSLIIEISFVNYYFSNEHYEISKLIIHYFCENFIARATYHQIFIWPGCMQDNKVDSFRDFTYKFCFDYSSYERLGLNRQTYPSKESGIYSINSNELISTNHNILEQLIESKFPFLQLLNIRVNLQI
jgi:hypothetical protein